MCGGTAPADRFEVIGAISEYLREQVDIGVPVKHVTRHLLGLFQGQPGARAWRRFISQNAHRDDRNYDILRQALDAAFDARTAALDAA